MNNSFILHSFRIVLNFHKLKAVERINSLGLE
jgi:hypothetical protein